MTRRREYDLEAATIAHFSGGRSSAVMLAHMIASGNPPDAAVMANTSMETHETLQFAWAVADNICRPAGVRFAMIELYHTPEGWRRTREIQPGEESTGGTLFREHFVLRNAVPNRHRRSCTNEFKVLAANRWVRDTLGARNYTSSIGMRADEPRRVAGIRRRNDALAAKESAGDYIPPGAGYHSMPLADAGISRAEVDATIAGWGKWADIAKGDTRLSNCVGCFFTGQKEQLKTFTTRPDLAKIWCDIEKQVNADRLRLGRGLKREPNMQIIKFHRKAFNEQMTPEQSKVFSFNDTHTWEQLRRLHIEGRRDLFSQQPDLPGGCLDGYCGTD